MAKSSFFPRIVISGLVGLAVFALSLLVLWLESPQTLMGNDNLWNWTLLSMRDFVVIIEERKAEGNPPPQSLKEIVPLLDSRTFPNSNIKNTRDGIPIDGWGRPILYSTNGTTYTLMSYGRDGKLGGSGLDAEMDQSLQHPSTDFRKPTLPTFRQFICELPSKGMIQSCVLNGVIAFFLSIFLVRSISISKRSLIQSSIKIVFTILASVFFATIIMQLHIPTSH